jgi:hypothetical protein
MTYEEILAQARGANGIEYRVRMFHDIDAQEPYDDGSVPLWRIDPSRKHADKVAISSYTASDVDLTEMLERWSEGQEVLRQLMKDTYGATRVEFWYSGTEWYMAMDTADWRQEMGVSPEQIRSEQLMAEFKAWVHGDVYGYVLERRVITYTTVVEESDGAIIGTERGERWEDVDGQQDMGLYGHAVAQAEARAAFEEFMAGLRESEKQMRFERMVTES